MISKKSISPVVIIALLLVVGIISTVILSQWFNLYISQKYVDTEQSIGNSLNKVQIDKLNTNGLYVKNNKDYNISIVKLMIENKSCNITGISNLSINSNILNISQCINNYSDEVVSIVLVTEDEITYRQFYVPQNGIKE